MPTAIREHQYELTSPAGVDGAGLVFGTEDTGYLTMPRPSLATDDGTTADVQRSNEDGVTFGVDNIGGKVQSFEMAVLTDLRNTGLPNRPTLPIQAHQQNLDYLDALEGWWRDPVWRETPQSIAMLRACEAGRVSRAYGRPRRFEPVVGNQTRAGYSSVVCDFQMINDLWYADEEQSGSVTISASPITGLIAPLQAPLTTMQASASPSGSIAIGGSRRTSPVIEFAGPITNPVLTFTSNAPTPEAQYDESFQVGIAYAPKRGEIVTVDARPWVRSVTTSDLSKYEFGAGVLDGSTPLLKRLSLRPGRTYSLVLSGMDPTGSATATVRWRTARSRP